MDGGHFMNVDHHGEHDGGIRSDRQREHGGHHAGPDHRGHPHDPRGHDHAHEVRGTGRRNLTAALVLIVGYMLAEVAGGLLSGSLALLADAGHMLTDAAAIALALVAMHVARRPASATRTFGYLRFEVLAALLNALALWLIAAWVIVEAWRRFMEPREVDGALMLAVGAGGLVVNVAAVWILHGSARHSLNIEGAFRHVIADLLGSLGVVVSAILVLAFGWTIADPILSVVIGVLILLSTWRLFAKVIHVLNEGVPDHIDVHRLCSRMEAVDGVVLIHDVHVWTIASGYDALTAHVLVDPGYPDDLDPLRRRLQEIAAHDFGIHHITIQVERSLDGCTEHHDADRPPAGARPSKRAPQSA